MRESPCNLPGFNTFCFTTTTNRWQSAASVTAPQQCSAPHKGCSSPTINLQQLSIHSQRGIADMSHQRLIFKQQGTEHWPNESCLDQAAFNPHQHYGHTMLTQHTAGASINKPIHPHQYVHPCTSHPYVLPCHHTFGEQGDASSDQMALLFVGCVLSAVHLSLAVCSAYRHAPGSACPVL